MSGSSSSDMGSHTGTERKVDDLWSQIIAEDGDDQRHNNQQKQQQIAVTYQRRKPDKPAENSKSSVLNNDSRLSFAGDTKRISWNRSLSTRGRISIAVTAYADCQPQQRGARRKQKPAIPKGKKVALLPNFEKERAYFQEVDAFELAEESPSPMKFAWIAGNQIDGVVIPSLCTRLEKWLHAKKRNYIPSSALSSILKTPAVPLEPIPYDGLESVQRGIISEEACLQNLDFQIIPEETNIDVLSTGGGEFDDIVSEIKKLSLSSHSSSLDGDHRDPFSVLLQECRQSAPLTLLDVFCKLCEPSSIVKIGEGTYGEAFIAGDNVCKIVPIDGDLRVNGEVQKRSVELLEEVILTQTLNHLRGREAKNATTTFIETKDLKVCQGPYDPALLKAWEAWDLKHGSENDHPKQFPEKQCYVVFVLEHGGTDLESFVLLDFNEARSLLAQVTLALSVAEAAFEFEHRDLHWGNILLSRKGATTLQFTLEGKTMFIKTHGLLVSIIDFTLSRINTGNTILYLDLSSDPELFDGPTGNKQSDTYRKMRELTDDQWEGSFPKTNVLWLQYLVDVLLDKKSYKRSGKDERELRSFKRRLNDCNSAKEAICDPFFSELLGDDI